MNGRIVVLIELFCDRRALLRQVAARFAGLFLKARTKLSRRDKCRPRYLILIASVKPPLHRPRQFNFINVPKWRREAQYCEGFASLCDWMSRNWCAQL